MLNANIFWGTFSAIGVGKMVKLEVNREKNMTTLCKLDGVGPLDNRPSTH